VNESAAFEYVREGVATPFTDHIYNNCSGKHAGFLALCKYLEEPLAGYLEVSHRVQQLVQEAVCDVFELNQSQLHAGVDGCNAPNYAMNARYVRCEATCNPSIICHAV
jgi:L-asparaginase II